MQIRLEQARRQLNSIQECERRLLQLRESLALIRGASTLRQEQFIYMNMSLKKQTDELYLQQKQLKKMIYVLDAAVECIERTERDVTTICGGGQYFYSRPAIRRMFIQHVIPLPNIVLD